MTESLDFIFKRRSIRKFTDRPISEEDLTLLLQAGMAAPTAMNVRPWEFVVVTDREIIQQLRDSLVFGKHDPAAVIAVCGNTRFSNAKAANRFWVQDCSAAMENILLAATALGFGSVWVGVHPVTLFVKRVSEVLNLPASITPLGLIYLGYPAEQKEPRTQYDARKVHWQQYGKGNGGSN
ncbi:MAG: nitroreductase family protein [Anaerolineaceae bacterium]